MPGPEREMNPQADNVRRYKIDADEDETAIDIILPPGLPRNRRPERYKIVKKDIPDVAKGKTYGGKKVKWINNFGIRLRGKFQIKQGGERDDPFIDEVQGERFSFEVVVPGPAPEGYPTLVYFDGTDVQPASVTIDSGGAYHFNLNIGDPPTGWGGG